LEEIIRDTKTMTPYQLMSAYKNNIENIDGGDGDWNISLFINNTFLFLKYLGGKLITLKLGLK